MAQDHCSVRSDFLRENGRSGPTHGNRLSTLNGCFVPCLLTILGAVLFLRVGFSVGMMGLWGALGILCFSELISYITVTSFSAIVSNGRTQGGGAYFLIARNLGPAFGGSSGLLFWVSYCINATYNVVAWTETFQQAFLPRDSWWASTENWSGPLISTITYFPLFLVAYKGAGTFAKVNWIVFVGLFVASIVATGSLFFYWTDITLDGEKDYTYQAFNLHTLQENMWPAPVESDQCASAAAFGPSKGAGLCNLQSVFGIIFPAVIGMMEGLNLSGDLREPERSIPKGTLWAVSVAFVLYALLLVGQAGTVSRAALQYKMNVMEHVTVGGGWFVVLGVATACLSTVLGSLFGAARILQAMARDEVFPCLTVFKYGTPSGDEPRPAIVLSYLLGQACILLGSLDDISPLLTNFFLMTYVLTDLACFLLEFSKVPNFRPRFRFYSWQTSLLNVVMVVAVMFYLSVVYAACTVFAVILSFGYITLRFRGHSDWIDISQALFSRVARRSVRAMGPRKDPKYWRPSLLLIPSDLPASCAEAGFKRLVLFLIKLKQKSLFVVGGPIVSEDPMAVCSGSTPGGEMERRLVEAVPEFDGFVQVAVAPGLRLAYANLLLGTGLGSLVPDTIVIPLPHRQDTLGDADFVQVLQDVQRLNKNALVAANFESSPVHPSSGAWRTDIWTFGSLDLPPLASGTRKPAGASEEASADLVCQLSLAIQMGYLSRAFAPRGALTKLRLVNVPVQDAASAEDADPAEALVHSWLTWARIPPAEAGVAIVPSQGERLAGSGHSLGAMNRVVQKESADAAVIFALLPTVEDCALLPTVEGGEGSAASEYVQQLRMLTSGLPPTLLAHNGQGFPVITTVM